MAMKSSCFKIKDILHLNGVFAHVLPCLPVHHPDSSFWKHQIFAPWEWFILGIHPTTQPITVPSSGSNPVQSQVQHGLLLDDYLHSFIQTCFIQRWSFPFQKHLGWTTILLSKAKGIQNFCSKFSPIAQLMVNCWFGFLVFFYERDCYLRAALEFQTTNPNQQLTISWVA